MKTLNLAQLLLLSFSVMGAALLSAAEPYPLDYFAVRSAVSNVEVSPNGKHVAMLSNPSKDGDPYIEVYKTDSLSAKPFRLNADPMEITSFYWATDDVIVFRARQQVRDKIDGFNQGVYEFVLASVDIKKKKIKKYEQAGASISNILPAKKNKVIYSFVPGNFKSSKLSSAFRPRAYYELNLKTGAKRLLFRGKVSMGQVETNGEGKPWLARGFDIQTGTLSWYARVNGEGEWEEFYSQHEDSFEEFSVTGYDTEKPNIYFVVANNGKDKAGLWEYDVKAKKFGELIYARKDVDIVGTLSHSNYWTDPDKQVAVSYTTDRTHREFFDGQEAAVYQQLQGIVPNAYYLRVNSRSRDGNTLTVYNQGPRDPGSYYLLHKGNFNKIGSTYPLLKPEGLADVKYIKYKARDGRTIPAYITVPNGKPPFPAVVMPHGGPFVAEGIRYDEWAQMLANNGYLVLQPQYRGSRGHGMEHYLSAFNTEAGGQGGYKMQDDKDDGMMYLVEQGLADKDRLAFYGWSYGGYAALIAAARTPNIYQCSIAGAAVTDNQYQVNHYRARIRGAGKLEQLRMWDDSISPIEEVEKVNIPLLVIHGSVDQRVPPAHARKYMDEVKKHGKKVSYVELDGADHFSNTLFYNHQKELYESIIGFLKNECGPGGL
ncbi:prolyl oligopeptidase family serine peptidase [uncultured Pseudoteredinibacter sp.]|uniref:alpha/beta hydrolase family protein n=1 Tax=uncultured Pseudoteredinibacter sp. TaxID=1641701 RepID=UPI002638E065|nr:prolyl oligopeptidase family serine peptidase [uncultured Pseudoteredinibacter sp.]